MRRKGSDKVLQGISYQIKVIILKLSYENMTLPGLSFVRPKMERCYRLRRFIDVKLIFFLYKILPEKHYAFERA